MALCIKNSALGQTECEPSWTEGFAFPNGLDGDVRDVIEYDDGAGSALYAAGRFTTAGGVLVNSVAKWDGSSWHPVGGGITNGQQPGTVYTLAVYDGELYAGGSFDSAGGTSSRNLARWNGTSWAPVGDGTTGTVLAMTVYNDGTGSSLYVGGTFQQIGGISARRIARWNGSAWSSLGSGAGGAVTTLAEFDDGNGTQLFAGGYYSQGGQFTAMLEKWDGSQWTAIANVPTGSSIVFINDLLVHDDGSGLRLFVGGQFTSIGSSQARGIASWDGDSWYSVGQRINTFSGVNRLARHDDGTGVALYAGSSSIAGTGGIEKWNGANWTSLGDGVDGTVRSMLSHSIGSEPALIAVGTFTKAGEVSANNTAAWSTGGWISLDGPMGQGFGANGTVEVMLAYTDPTGSALYAGGRFTSLGGVRASGVGKWDGRRWHALGGGVVGRVLALAILDNGTGPVLYAGGWFSEAGGVPASNVAKWTGTEWLPVGNGLSGTVYDFAIYDSGDGLQLYAGGTFTGNIARWDGSHWQAVGSGVNSTVRTLFPYDDGTGNALYAAGDFATAGGLQANRIARWNGAEWQAVGSGFDGNVFALEAFNDGTGYSLYAGGSFQQTGNFAASGIARWDGFEWLPLGGNAGGPSGGITSLHAHHSSFGSALYAAGSFFSIGAFPNTTPAGHVARWDGNEWSTLDVGVNVSQSLAIGSSALALESLVDGSESSLYIAGNFSQSGNVPASRIARWGCEINLFSHPDLIAAELDAPAVGLSGQQTLVSWRVENIGTAPAAGPWVDRLYINNSPGLAGAYPLADVAFTGSLQSGDHYVRSQEVLLPQLAGEYWLIIATDADDAVYEGPGGSENNVLISPTSIVIHPVPGPDLVVTDVAPPTSGSLSGTSVELSWLVTNQGTGPTAAPAWLDGVYLLPSDNLSQFDIPCYIDFVNAGQWLGQFRNPSYLPASESYAQTATVTLPPNIQGTFYIAVYTDNRRSACPWRLGQTYDVDELDEFNNLTFSEPFTISLQPQADLVVEDIEFLPLAASGMPFSTAWTVRNAGSGPTGPPPSHWTDAIYLSVNDEPVISPDDILLDTVRYTGAPLAPQGAASRAATSTLDPSLAGTFYVKIETDIHNEVSEIGAASNNISVSSSQVSISLTPPVDLLPLLVGGPSTGNAGHEIAVDWTVVNDGGPPTFSLSWSDRLYLSPTSSFDPNTAVALGTFGHQTSLDPDGNLAIPEYTKIRNVRLPNDVTAGEHYFVVQVDVHNEVFEGTAGEQNNILVSPDPIAVTRIPADLEIAVNFDPSRPTPSSGAAADGIDLYWRVRNVGDSVTPVAQWRDRVFLSTNPSPSAGDIPVATRTRNGTLEPGAHYDGELLASVPLTSPGEYYLLFKADADDQVFEHGLTSNNVVTVPFTVTGEAADLAVTAVSAPTTAAAGTSLSLSWTVRNDGERRTNASNWVDRVYISTEPSWSPAATPLATRTRSGSLAPDELYFVELSASLPIALPAGAYHIIVRTDVNDAVYELNTANNELTAPAIVSLAAAEAANLVVESVDADSQTFAGQTLGVTWTVRNTGEAVTNANAWRDHVYLSRDQFLDPGDRYIGFYRRSGELEPGQDYTAQAAFDLPPGLSGPYFVIILTDAHDQVYEAGRTEDNIGVSTGITDVEIPEPGDLFVRSIQPPSTAVLGQDAEFGWEVQNDGPGTVSGRWTDAVFLSPNDTWNISDRSVGRFGRSPVTLAPGEATPGGGSARVPPVTPGEYHVIVRTDVFNQIPETDKTNNLKVSLGKVEVTAIPLTLGVPYEGTLATGDELYFEFDTPSNETVKITLDHASPAAFTELYVKRGAVPTRGDFDFAFGNPGLPDQEIVIPATEAGKYYIMASATSGAHGGSPSGVTVLADVVPFGISDVQPPVVGNGVVTLRLEGSRWGSQTTFAVRRSGTTEEVEPMLQDVESATRGRARFDLSRFAPGDTLDLIVRMGAGGTMSVLLEAVEVEGAHTPTLTAEQFLPSSIRRGTSGNGVLLLTNHSNIDVPIGEITLGMRYQSGLELTVYLPETDPVVIRYEPASGGYSFNQFVVEWIPSREPVAIPFVLQVPPNYSSAGASIAFFAEAYTRTEFADEVVLPPLYKFVSQQRQSNPLIMALANEEYDEFVDVLLTGLRDHVNEFGLANGEETDSGLPKFSPTSCETCKMLCAFVRINQVCGRLKKPVLVAACIALWADYCATCNLCCRVLDPCNPVCPSARLPSCAPDCGDPVVVPENSECPSRHCSFVPRLTRYEFPGTPVGVWVWTCEERCRVMPPCIPTPGPTDPNEKGGPASYGVERWASNQQPLGYRIYFENIPDATAPASEVFIADALDPSLNPGTFRVGDIQIGDLVIRVPPGRIFHQERIDLTQERGVYVDITVGVNMAVNPPEAFWSFRSIDPATGLPPTSGFDGFLPPNNEFGEGEGHVDFTIQPRMSAVTGTLIENEAVIVFDFEEPIITNTVFNTLDADPAISNVGPLPAISTNPEIELTLAGMDPPGGSGFAGHRVLVSIDGSSFVPFLSQTPESSTVYVAKPGHVYRFAAQGIDNAGNIEPMPTQADAVTTAPIVRLKAESDSGEIGNGVTNVTSPVFEIVWAPHAGFEVLLMGPGVMRQSSGQANAQGRDEYAVDPSEPLPDGDYTIIVSDSSNSTSLNFRIDTVAPAVGQWESVAEHGGLGVLSVPLGFEGKSSEPRLQAEATTLWARYIADPDFERLLPESVSVVGAYIGGSPVDLSQHTVEFGLVSGDGLLEIVFTPELPDAARYCVTLNGVTDSAGNPLEGGIISFTMLAGDANGDRRVNNTDVGGVVSLVGADPIDPSELLEIRSDLNRDGRVDQSDVDLALSSRRSDARFIPDPCMDRGRPGGPVPGPTVADTAPRDTAMPTRPRRGGARVPPSGEPRDTDALGAGFTVEFTFEGRPRPIPLDTTRIAFYAPDGAAHEAGMFAAIDEIGVPLHTVTPWHLPGWWIADAPKRELDNRGQEPRSDCGCPSGEAAGHGGVAPPRNPIEYRALLRRFQSRGVYASPVLIGDDGGPMFVPPYLLVGVDPELDDRQRSALLSAAMPTAAVIESDFAGLEGLFLILVQDGNGLDVLDAANQVAKMVGVVYAEPDMVFTGVNSFAADSDAVNFNDGFGQHEFDADIDLVHRISDGCESVIVAVIGQGISPDLPGVSQLMGINLLFDLPDDIEGQGLFRHDDMIALQLAGKGVDASSPSGVAPGSSLLPLHALKAIGDSGQWASQTRYTLEAIDWAELEGARITVNNHAYGFASNAIAARYRKSHERGVLHFAHSRRVRDKEASFPSVLGSVLGVADLAVRASHDSGRTDIFAPGSCTHCQIISNNAVAEFGPAPSGASIAYAAGGAALMMSINPELDAAGIADALLGTSIHDKGVDGLGTRLDVYAATRRVVVAGDMDGDGVLTEADIRLFYDRLINNDLDPSMDLNGDGRVGVEDLQVLIDLVSSDQSR